MILNGDCLDKLAGLADNSVDSLVTDPPAGISFMGKAWDTDKGGRKEWIAWMAEVMRECLRVMKPGAHGLVWAIPRTSHWTATALEDAGFEVRDVVTHLFGSGFPKSLDVSKAIDKAAGAERVVTGYNPKAKQQTGQKGTNALSGDRTPNLYITAPSTDSAKQWQGWGTALKPASEHWILVRKPCSEKTVAANVLKWGTGALNIDASRVSTDRSKEREYDKEASSGKTGSNKAMFAMGDSQPRSDGWLTQGRFPANLVFSHTLFCEQVGTKNVKSAVPSTRETPAGLNPYGEGLYGESKGVSECTGYADPDGQETVETWDCADECAVKGLDEQSGTTKSQPRTLNGAEIKSPINAFGDYGNRTAGGFFDSGGASRFFYCAKISKSERNAGLEGMAAKEVRRCGDRAPHGDRLPQRALLESNHHPTVKPKKLMAYLCRMITPPHGVVLDPFMGSGSTGIAAKECGFKFIGIEKELEYFEIAQKRIKTLKPMSVTCAGSK